MLAASIFRNSRRDAQNASVLNWWQSLILVWGGLAIAFVLIVGFRLSFRAIDDRYDHRARRRQLATSLDELDRHPPRGWLDALRDELRREGTRGIIVNVIVGTVFFGLGVLTSALID